MYFLVSCQIWEAFRQIWAQKIYETWSFFQRLWFTYQKFWTKLFKEKWTLWPHLKFKYLNNNGIINTLSFKIFYAADPEFADFLSGKWTNWYEPNSDLFTSLGSEMLTSGIVFWPEVTNYEDRRSIPVSDIQYPNESLIGTRASEELAQICFNLFI